MSKLMLSRFRNDTGRVVWQAVYAGSPLCEETDEATARAVLNRAAFQLASAHVTAVLWDSESGTEGPLALPA
jgi:hypothetical protein